MYDPETGIMRDINMVYNYCGAYCFHDQLTADTCALARTVSNSGLQVDINSKQLYKDLVLIAGGGLYVASLVSGIGEVASLKFGWTAFAASTGTFVATGNWFDESINEAKTTPWLVVTYNGNILFEVVAF